MSSPATTPSGTSRSRSCRPACCGPDCRSHPRRRRSCRAWRGRPEHLVEPRSLPRRSAAEGLLGDSQRHREQRSGRRGVDLVGDRLEQIGKPLHAIGLRRRHRQQHNMRQRRYRICPFDVEAGLERPECRGTRPGLAAAVAGVVELRIPLWEYLLEVGSRQSRKERVMEMLQISLRGRTAIRVHERNRLTLPIVRDVMAGYGNRRDRIDAVCGPNLLRRVAMQPRDGRAVGQHACCRRVLMRGDEPCGAGHADHLPGEARVRLRRCRRDRSYSSTYRRHHDRGHRHRYQPELAHGATTFPFAIFRRSTITRIRAATVRERSSERRTRPGKLLQNPVNVAARNRAGRRVRPHGRCG